MKNKSLRGAFRNLMIHTLQGSFYLFLSVLKTHCFVILLTGVWSQNAPGCCRGSSGVPEKDEMILKG